LREVRRTEEIFSTKVEFTSFLLMATTPKHDKRSPPNFHVCQYKLYILYKFIYIYTILFSYFAVYFR
jgi:hypothetical protein